MEQQKFVFLVKMTPKNQSNLIDMKYTFIFSAKDYALISDSDSIVLTDQNIPPKS